MPRRPVRPGRIQNVGRGGAPRSESQIAMIAGGNHTIIYLTPPTRYRCLPGHDKRILLPVTMSLRTSAHAGVAIRSPFSAFPATNMARGCGLPRRVAPRNDIVGVTRVQQSLPFGNRQQGGGGMPPPYSSFATAQLPQLPGGNVFPPYRLSIDTAHVSIPDGASRTPPPTFPISHARLQVPSPTIAKKSSLVQTALSVFS